MSKGLEAAQNPVEEQDGGYKWTHTASGKFCVASAYTLLTAETENLSLQVWHRIWKLKGPQRLNFSLWKILPAPCVTGLLRTAYMNFETAHGHLKFGGDSSTVTIGVHLLPRLVCKHGWTST